MNEIKGYLRDFRLSVPDSIYECRGIKIFGRRIKYYDRRLKSLSQPINLSQPKVGWGGFLEGKEKYFWGLVIVIGRFL